MIRIVSLALGLAAGACAKGQACGKAEGARCGCAGGDRCDRCGEGCACGHADR